MANGTFYGYNPAEWRKDYSNLRNVFSSAAQLISTIPEVQQEYKMSQEREDYASLAKQGTDALLQGLMIPENEEIKNDIKAAYGVESDEELASIWEKSFSEIRSNEDIDTYRNRVAAGMANMAEYLNASGKDPSVLAYVLKAQPDGSVLPQNAMKAYSDSINRASNKKIYQGVTDLGEEATEEDIYGSYAQYGRQPDDWGKDQIGKAKVRKTQGLIKQASDEVINMMVQDPSLLSLDGKSLSSLQATLDSKYPPEVVKRVVDTGYKDLQLKASAERLKAGDEKAVLDSIRRLNDSKDKALVNAERIKNTIVDNLRVNEVELAKANEAGDKKKAETLKAEQARIKRGLKLAEKTVDGIIVSDYGTLAGAAGAAEREIRGEESKAREEFVSGISEPVKGGKGRVLTDKKNAFLRFFSESDYNIKEVKTKADESGYSVIKSQDNEYNIIDPATDEVVATFNDITGEVSTQSVMQTGGKRLIPEATSNNPLEQFMKN